MDAHEEAVDGAGLRSWQSAYDSPRTSQTLFDVDAPRQKCDKAAELELAKNEDASSTLAVHPEVRGRLPPGRHALCAVPLTLLS